MRLCSRFRNQSMVFSFVQKLAHFAIRIIKIPEIHAMRRAYRHASRVHAFFHAVNAECAFIYVTLRMNEPRVVRTRGNARLAPDAFIMIHEDHAAVIMNMACPGWAAINARWIVAVIASLGADLEMYVREFSFCVLRDPVAVKSFRHVVLRFACYNAIHTAYAFFGVNHHCQSCHAYASISKVTKLTFIAVPPIRGSVVYFVISPASLAPLPNARLSILELCPNP